MKLFIACFAAVICSVYGGNVACDKLNAYQSTTGTWGGIIAGATRAIDANVNTNWFSGGCTHTQPNDPDPSLTIDLGCEKTITRVEIANRHDCCTGRLNDFEIVVTKTPYSRACRCVGDVCAHYAGSFPAGRHSVTCSARGRFVTIRYKTPQKQPASQRYIHVCDVKVF